MTTTSLTDSWIEFCAKVAAAVPAGTPNGRAQRRDLRISMAADWLATPAGREVVLGWLTADTPPCFADEQQAAVLCVALGKRSPVYFGAVRRQGGAAVLAGPDVDEALATYYRGREAASRRQTEGDARRNAEWLAKVERAPAIRRALQAALRKFGFKLERSAAGSNYYSKWLSPCAAWPAGRESTIRLSDHAVPETEERTCNHGNGQRSWAHTWFADVTAYATPDAAVADLIEHLGADERETEA